MKMDSRTMGACRKKSSDGRKSNRKREKPVTRTVVIWPVSTWNMLSLNFRMKATDKPRAAEERRGRSRRRRGRSRRRRGRKRRTRGSLVKVKKTN